MSTENAAPKFDRRLQPSNAHLRFSASLDVGGVWVHVNAGACYVSISTEANGMSGRSQFEPGIARALAAELIAAADAAEQQREAA